ncbi:hypothetical protein [Tessaracoccus sp. MC1756]|uniref:hypothetical protein n=1 Tax=Tessaracoccus sp. MC1756 TaxID=2760311 RepID=UPI0016035546|nr:hypothetical protein [Tessaracoccus sp. MC1756]MBB1509678.1 hypothetical protein [Tessaracoccus sp. MC1756]
MSAMAESFNRSRFGSWINNPSGRVFRVAAGAAFLAAGLAGRGSVLGLASIAWSILPLTAGLFDVCYISAAVGGPLRGGQCRAASSAPT